MKSVVVSVTNIASSLEHCLRTRLINIKTSNVFTHVFIQLLTKCGYINVIVYHFDRSKDIHEDV